MGFNKFLSLVNWPPKSFGGDTLCLCNDGLLDSVDGGGMRFHSQTQETSIERPYEDSERSYAAIMNPSALSLSLVLLKLQKVSHLVWTGPYYENQQYVLMKKKIKKIME